jgi:probable HAF family extracellular repeat protein
MPINVYTTLDDPKAANGTFAYGINASGQVVGYYLDFTGGGIHGFLYSGGTYTTLDDPDGGPRGQTFVQGINDSGRIVGYFDDGFGNEIGFVRTGSSYARIIEPSSDVIVNGISGLNEVVGEYSDFVGSNHHGFVEILDLSLFANLDYPNNLTYWNGINAAGTEVVGKIQTGANPPHGLLYNGPANVFTVFNDPLGDLGTVAQGINDAGLAVGYYYDKNSLAHGFIYDTRGTTFTTVDVGTRGTFLTGINDAGELVGYYTDSSNHNHGFIRTTLPNPAPAGGTTAAMILRGSDSSGAVAGQYEIYDIGNNAILAGYLLGQAGTDYQFAGLGRFFDGDTVDMMLRSASTGAFEVYDISNNNITNAASLGAVGTTWQVAGFADLNSDGMTDMLLRNSGTGAFEVYNISNNNITNTAALGTVGLDWQVGGFGNFSSLGESDMVMRNANTGAMEVYDINSNQITGAAFMGTVGLDWQIFGAGNFSSMPGETDVMMRNKNTGGLEVYDIANNQITGAAFLGTVGLDWLFAGVAPVHAAGASDLVLRNGNTGAFEVYDIANTQLTGAAPLGSVGLDWQLGGFAADPPTGSMGSSDGSTSQLVQAMAGFGGGAADTSNTVPLGPETSQQLLTTSQHV